MTWSRGLGLKGPDSAMLVRTSAPLPSLDPRTLGYNYMDMFGPIEDQGQTSECWCYSSGGLFEAYHYRRTKGERIVISKRALASLTNARISPANTMDHGGYPSDAITTLESGYVLEDGWPDDTGDDSVQMAAVPPALVRTDFTSKNVCSVPATLDSVILAGHAHGPVVLCVGWPREWYTAKPLDGSGLLVALQNPTEIVGYHAVVLYAHLPATLHDPSPLSVIRNSWGTAWGGGLVPPGYAAMRDSDLAAILTDGCCCEVIP